MRAVVLEEYGSSEVLKLQEIPDLEPGRGEVRVEVRASAVNRADTEERMGTDRAINTTEEDFDQVVKEATASHGADVILDFIGADYLEKNLKAAALEGRIVQIATLSSSSAQLDLRQVMGKRLRLQGTTLRSRFLEQKMALTQKFTKQMLPFFASGRLKPIIDRSFKLEEVAQAHRYMESNSNFGKIVLKIS